MVRTHLPLSALAMALMLAACDTEQAPPSVQEVPAPETAVAPATPPAAKAEPPALSKPADSKELPSATDEEVQDATADKDDEDLDDTANPKDSKKRRASKGSRRRSRSKGSAGEEHADSASKDTSAKKSRGDTDGQPLTLKRIQLAEAIKDREPVNPEDTFSMGSATKLYAFLELSNGSEEEQKVTVTFVPPQGGATKVTLDVGPQKRWRTWALRKALTTPGTWRVVVRDLSGHELGSRSFEVTE